MAERAEVVGIVGGEVVSNTDAKGAREAVLALPLGRLLVRMVRIPAEQKDDVEAVLTPILQAMSPYPDEPLTIGWETVRETERGLLVLAAALPESSADDIAETLDAQKLNITRIDALLLGELRALWSALAPNGELGTARRMLLLSGPDGVEMLVLDGDAPSAIRAISAGADLRREAMLSLLEAEDFGGVRKLEEIVTVGEIDGSVLTSFAPVRAVAPVSTQDVLDALAARSLEPGTLDARPASWREVLEETRFKAKLIRNVSIAVGVWLLAMGVLFGVPMVYDYLTDYQKGLSKRHQRAYSQVCEMEKKVRVFREYSDHVRGALEMMKAVSDRLPDDVVLDSFVFKKGDGLSFSGVADNPQSAYTLKNELDALADETGNRVFGQVKLGRVTATKSGQKFPIDCKFPTEEALE